MGRVMGTGEVTEGHSSLRVLEFQEERCTEEEYSEDKVRFVRVESPAA